MAGGIKGYPATQKLVKQVPSGIPEFVTLQPQDANLRAGIDVVGRFAFRVDSSTVARTAQAGTGNGTDGGPTIVQDTATPARVGDFVRFEDGQAQYLELPIVAVSTNSFTLGARLSNTLVPSAGDTFFIMRYAMQRVDTDGTQLVTVTPSPIAFVLDGVDTEVEEDTLVPANNKPLPVKAFDHNNEPIVQPPFEPFDLIRLDYGTTPVDDTTYVQILAATAQKTNSLTLFDGGGYAMVLALGPALSEVDYLYIPPGGFNGALPIEIPTGVRLSIKCLETGVTVNAGQIVINLME